jgi:iron complex outermembrane recepter protein
VLQSQLALLGEREVAGGTVRASVFTGSRTLDNPLPFAIVAIERNVAGGSLHGTWRLSQIGASPLAWPVRVGAGIDVQQQVDERYNFENCAALAATAPATTACPRPGVERGSTRLEQQERATNVGGYGRVEVEAPHGFFASAALRRDEVRFRVRDRFVTNTNADDSGDRTLQAVSPMLGLVWRARPQWSLYANLSSAFETPTVTELTNQETGAAGLNATLEPQRTRTTEVGTQALLGGHLRADLALFRAVVLDELVPFDVPNQPGRRAFRNAGRTTRTGVETSVRGQWRSVDVGTAYTYSRFRFDRYDVGSTSFAGQRIPGVPTHYLQAFGTVRRGPLWSSVETTASSQASANDAGTITGAGFAVWNWRAGLDVITIGGVRLEPTASVENLFDRRHASSLVINATRNRYFEPGLPRRISVLVTLSR